MRKIIQFFFVLAPILGIGQVDVLDPSVSTDVISKTDTIEVEVLCTKIADSDLDALLITKHDERYVFTYIAKRRLERALEYRTVYDRPNSGKNSEVFGVLHIKSAWVPVSTRWLDDINGCYQLIQLEK